jgi:uncharacterized membrane protein
MSRTLPDTKLQHLIGKTLRTGVMVASLTGVLGGAIFLTVHGGQPVSFQSFDGAGSPYAAPWQIVRQAFALHTPDHANQGLAITQLGIILLMLTPIVRVAFSIIGFARERDHIYVAITAIVLVTLIGSLMLG